MRVDVIRASAGGLAHRASEDTLSSLERGRVKASWHPLGAPIPYPGPDEATAGQKRRPVRRPNRGASRAVALGTDLLIAFFELERSQSPAFLSGASRPGPNGAPGSNTSDGNPTAIFQRILERSDPLTVESGRPAEQKTGAMTASASASGDSLPLCGGVLGPCTFVSSSGQLAVLRRPVVTFFQGLRRRPRGRRRRIVRPTGRIQSLRNGRRSSV